MTSNTTPKGNPNSPPNSGDGTAGKTEGNGKETKKQKRKRRVFHDWHDSLPNWSENGPQATFANAVHAFRYAPEFHKRFRYDEHAGRTQIEHWLPWDCNLG